MLTAAPWPRQGRGAALFPAALTATMNSALLSQLRHAAATAESRGGDAFTLGGTSYTGTLNELSTQVPGTATGFEIVRELHIVARRAQFSAKPSAATRPAVTALGGSWYLTNVGESDLHYFLTCRPA